MSNNKTPITPYTLSTFGRAFTGTQDFTALLLKPEANIEDVRVAWAQLHPNLNSMLCLQDEEGGTLSLINEKCTGMSTAEAQGLPPECTQTWDRLRVLQGLLGHLQMWLMCSTHFVVTHPDTPGMFDYNARRLICEIYEALCSNDAIEEVEDWVAAVISKAQEDDEADASV